MNLYKSVLILGLFVFGNIGLSHAHALYIDTNPNGEIGERHEVKVYYSEFADRVKEKITDWFSDAAQFELWLIRPDGSRIQLTTTNHENHVSSSFIPQKNGIYRLVINHTTAKVPKGTAYQFNAYAQVVVGEIQKSTPIGNIESGFALVRQKSAQENKKLYKVYFRGEPKEGIAVSLFLPSGKVKKLKTGENGNVKFDVNKEGVYFLEATIFQKGKKGKTKSDSYQSLWRCATQKFELLN